MTLLFILLPFLGFSWQIGPFARIDAANPIIQADPKSVFHCPILTSQVDWESAYTFNPAAVIRDEKVYIIYRAEDNSGSEIGKRTSRLGLAASSDGIHFERMATPILYPEQDDQQDLEWPGGCEDPRVVETENGDYVMTYTQWNKKKASLGIAISKDLIHWKKLGPAFGREFESTWTKSGSIVCRCEEDRLIANKIQGKYWMYFGEGAIYIATSEDLISWKIILNDQGKPLSILSPRPGLFDGVLVEPGPPAILTKDGIILLYNGKNSVVLKNLKIPTRSYCAGQVLFDQHNPMQILDRPEECFLIPERPYEKTGQYKKGTVFVEGLVHFQGRWFLYYGMADSAVGVAVAH